MSHRLISHFLTPMYLIKDTDIDSINNYRKLYTSTSMFAKRESVKSKDTILISNHDNTFNIPVTVYKPHTENNNELLPVILYFHGGGYTLGDVPMYEHITTVMAKRSKVAVVGVEYRLAPEHRFPTAHEDCIDATRWFLDPANVDKLGLDASRVGVAGDSAGGNIAAVVGSEFPSQLKVLVSIYPGSIVSGTITSSKLENAHAPILSIDDKNWFHSMYYGTRRDLGHHPLYSPLSREDGPVINPDTGVAVYPITHVITAELDILRDDGETYAEYLRKSGVKVTLTRYNNTPHGFFGMNLFPHGTQALLDTCEFITNNI